MLSEIVSTADWEKRAKVATKNRQNRQMAEFRWYHKIHSIDGVQCRIVSKFSTQNLMLYKFYLTGLAKFRHLANLAILGGYFGSFLPIGSSYDFTEHSFGIVRSCQT